MLFTGEFANVALKLLERQQNNSVERWANIWAMFATNATWLFLDTYGPADKGTRMGTVLWLLLGLSQLSEVVI